MASQSRFDVIIIGAGIGGLSAAKTYLELAPDTDILVLEQRATLGGVWAEEYCYEGLKTNNLYGTYEYSDFPMTPAYGVNEGSHIPGMVVHKYLKDFAACFNLDQCIRYLTKVIEAEKLSSAWKLRVEDLYIRGGGSNSYELICDKLIVSSGLASTANPVSYPGKDSFEKPVLNHAQLRDEAFRIAEDPDTTSIAVVGASKTGYDAVQLMASHGKKVTWIIRESGGGAVWMSSPWIPLGPWMVMLEHIATMRFFSWFSPCIWGEFDGFGWIRKFLHETRLGRFLVHHLWEKFRWGTVEANGYRKHEELKYLEPDESLFWSARVGILNYPDDIHKFILSGQVNIVKKDIAELCAGGNITFTDGSIIQTDALIGVTGWKLGSTFSYKPEGIEGKIGIPTSNLNEKDKDIWETLEYQADAEILRRFPYLRHYPQKTLPYKQIVTPYHLYRGMAPPGLTIEGDRSLVFMKFVHSTSNFVIAETQALWAYAYLNNKLNKPIDHKSVFWNTALTSRYGRWRHPCGFSTWYPEFVYDVIPYADMLLDDLGVRNKRKQSWKEEIFSGYVIQDYQGINQEWKALRE